MKTFFWPNLMFEDELAHGTPQLPGVVARVTAELSPLMGLLHNPVSRGNESAASSRSPCHVIMPSGQLPSGLPESLRHVEFVEDSGLHGRITPNDQLVPWGWSEMAVELCHRFHLRQEVPAIESVRTVNSRRFLADFDVCCPCGLPQNGSPVPFGHLCRNIHDVSNALIHMDGRAQTRWVIKSDFSQAARNRLPGQGRSLEPPQLSWLQKRFDRDEPVYLEPWLDRMAECGLQFLIPSPANPHLPVQFLGACEMLTDKAGRYRGSIVSRNKSFRWWEPAVPYCETISNAARRLGFFGPIGFDCMLFRNGLTGKLWLRPCHDINGRLTMGRVALALERWLNPGETGFWCHSVPKSSHRLSDVAADLKIKDVRIVPTSPTMIGAQATSLQTALLISDDCQSLLPVARKILSEDIRGPFL